MTDIIDAAIASPHWEACGTCKFHTMKHGCIKNFIDMSVHLGDWIICDDYERDETA